MMCKWIGMAVSQCNLEQQAGGQIWLMDNSLPTLNLRHYTRGSIYHFLIDFLKLCIYQGQLALCNLCCKCLQFVLKCYVFKYISFFFFISAIAFVLSKIFHIKKTDISLCFLQALLWFNFYDSLLNPSRNNLVWVSK